MVEFIEIINQKIRVVERKMVFSKNLSKVNEMKKSEEKFPCFKQVNFDRSKNCEIEKFNYEDFTFRF